MKFKFLKSSLFLSLASLCVMGCQDDDSNVEGINNNSTDKNNSLILNDKDPVVIKLLDLGFNLKNIEEYEDFFLVENDILFNKNEKKSETVSKTAQVHANSLVFMENVNNITVRIDSSIPASGNDNWRTAIATAISDWNNIIDCRINFTITTNSTADILIGSDGNILPNNNPAAAFLPSNGKPGSQIAINLDAANNTVFSEKEKEHIIKHELGHTIGFYHTDGPSKGEQTTSFNWIQYTPSGYGTNQDPNSVMNAGWPYSFILSSYDIFSAKYLYPDSYFINELISFPLENTTIYNSGSFETTWRPSFIPEANVKIEIFVEGLLVKTSIEKNDGHTIISAYGSGNYKIKISSQSNSNLYDESSFYFVND
ncbi:M57 family metalloprotease [Flavobacterium flavigenum]|uniref:M57 family metalloprotease n=1 Tax=Flavobacterium flavigenum TaxID=3003258 RepID=UPI0022ABC8DF|nr:M57 family metalloprotease [Flavobacterium flavigenum]